MTDKPMIGRKAAKSEGRGQDSLLEPYRRTRKTDPDTSLAAASTVTGITGKQVAVLMVLKEWGPATDEEIRGRYPVAVNRFGVSPQSESGLRTRRSELVRRGLVKDSGERKPLESGRLGIVWEAT